MGSNPAKRATPPTGTDRPTPAHGRRLFLFHWDAAEAAEHARRLRDGAGARGWRVDVESADGARGGAAVRASPPDVVVIHLTRLPSHGRETADYLASAKATRHVPIVFVGGAGDALAKTKQRVPGATFVADDAGLDATLASLVAGGPRATTHR